MIKNPVKSDHNRVLHDANGEIVMDVDVNALLAIADAAEEYENAVEVFDDIYQNEQVNSPVDIMVYRNAMNEKWQKLQSALRAGGR